MKAKEASKATYTLRTFDQDDCSVRLETADRDKIIREIVRLRNEGYEESWSLESSDPFDKWVEQINDGGDVEYQKTWGFAG